MGRSAGWKVVSAIEFLVAAAVIILDLVQPTLVILAMIVLSLLARRDRLSTLGLKRVEDLPRILAVVFGLVIVWQLFHLGVTKPVLNHLTGATQDLSDFENLKGNVGQLALLLVLSWTLAGFGEELVYRGYLQARLTDFLGLGRNGVILAVAASSVLFGLAHREQGLIGVVLTAMDAVFFSALKWKFGNNLWAAVLAHALSNTIGLVAFFFLGPIFGFW